MQHKVLIIDDDCDSLEALDLILTRHAFKVLKARSGAVGLSTAFQYRPDAIILDINMPGMDGFEACRRLREMTDAPILVLTGERSSTKDIVKGLNLGADQYMTRPFEIPELISRLESCLRRASVAPKEAPSYLLPMPGVTLDCERHELVLDGKTIYLSPSEFEVLQLLVRYAGRALSREAILAQAWGPDHIGDGHLVKQYIYQLRQKIEANPAEPEYIHTVRGEGYYFDTNGHGTTVE